MAKVYKKVKFLIYFKYHLCKLLGRTYDPYKNISKVKDIVQQHVLQDIQKKKVKSYSEKLLEKKKKWKNCGKNILKIK
ncbi:hypothetical protein PFDG_03423 [Plasmodium falciparum Dd2]|uniref:Uncharacterized protein n=1 Tax=Plasmodium falciparum (isolate Dd2) TaxID=57267 RepID=A0A0L7M379_PLAF4|nr:hypothetical protein PFDG_03423 [Plasmodium falciparum Dd2]